MRSLDTVPQEQLMAEMRHLTDRVVAQRYGIPCSTITRWRVKWGVSAKVGVRSGVIPRLHERIYSQLTHERDGCTMGQLAERFSVSRQAIHQAMAVLRRRVNLVRLPGKNPVRWAVALTE